jgi:hypothetical protein
MRSLKAVLATAVLTTALTGTAVALAGPASAVCEGGYPAAECTVALSDSTVVPGQPLTFSGSGYTPGEEATATVFSTPILVGTYTADGSGVVTGTFTVPDLDPGRHTLRVVGTTSGVIRASSFTVVAEEAGAAPVTPGGPASPLPFTGSDIAKTAGFGSLLLVGGGALLMASKRRRHVNAAL